MIISHKHQFIFFAVPKTATHAVREVLRPQAGSDYWEQQALQGRQQLPIPELAKIVHGHITVAQARHHLPEKIWANYRKVAFVRNPFDRFVSACAFLTRGSRPVSEQFRSNPEHWMTLALQRDQFRSRVLIRPQTEQLFDEGLEGVDFIGRYETLQSSLDEMSQFLGLAECKLPIKNASSHAAWQSYYDGDLADAVRDFYSSDFSNFAYPTSIQR